MADKIVNLLEDMGVRVRYVDMGDGTFAPSAVDGRKDDWQAITITGRTADPTKTIEQNFADGTKQSIYFDSAGEWAGRSARA